MDCLKAFGIVVLLCTVGFSTSWFNSSYNNMVQVNVTQAADSVRLRI